jgi:hypothetical protein
MDLRVCFGRWECAERDGPGGDEAPARKSGTKAGQIGRDGSASMEGSSVSTTGSRKVGAGHTMAHLRVCRRQGEACGSVARGSGFSPCILVRLPFVGRRRSMTRGSGSVRPCDWHPLLLLFFLTSPGFSPPSAALRFGGSMAQGALGTGRRRTEARAVAHKRVRCSRQARPATGAGRQRGAGGQRLEQHGRRRMAGRRL